MCVGARYVSSEWMPLYEAIWKFWRIKRIKYHVGYVGQMEMHYCGWIAYVQTYPLRILGFDFGEKKHASK